MKFESLRDLLDAVKDAAEVNGGVKIKNPRIFQGALTDRLAHTAVFGQADAKAAAKWIIWEAAWELGIQSASIDSLYQARARGDYEGKSVPAINVRAMAYDMGRAIVSSALQDRVGAFIFELARSEMEYTEQGCDEFATVMMAACIREGYAGPVFIQGDHYQANAKKYATEPEAVIGGLKQLIREAVAAGYANIDIDTSTLVDLSHATVDDQQRTNYERCAELAAVIRELEPTGVTISIGGEIGEVGKENSTVKELDAFVHGFNREFEKRVGTGKRGLSKISVNTGSSHGGVVLPDGTIAKVSIDFETLRAMSTEARTFGMGGAVQHGASTLPAEAFGKFPEVGTVEVHLATEFQNIILDHSVFPDGLKSEMYAYCRQKLGNEWASGDTEEQFLYKTRKKIWGPFKQQTWDLSEDIRSSIRTDLQQKFRFLFARLGVCDTRDLVTRTVTPRRISKPQPDALKTVNA